MAAAPQALSTLPLAAGRATTAARAHPALWVPTLYFAMGTPMTAVTVMSAVMYKNVGLSNAEIALYTGSMYLPWVVKPLWSPLVEMFGTKRTFVLATETAMAVTFGSLALALHVPHALAWSTALFWVIGFLSATQDVAADGVYITAMTHREQATYVGVQGVFWNLGRIIATGLLVTLTGLLHGRMGLDWVHSWMMVMVALAALLGLSAAWHGKVLPSGGRPADAPASLGGALRT